MYLVEMGNSFDFLSLHRKDCSYDYVNINNNESVLSILLNKMYGSKMDRKLFKSFVKIFSVLVSYQIDFNIPVDSDENTAFMVTLGLKDMESATLCAKHLRRLDLSIKNKYGENATSLCFKLGYKEILDIIKKNPTFNYYYRDSVNQNSLLMLSVINNGVCMKELLENDPNIINEVNCKNENALIIAVKANQVKAVETLLNYGIDINQQDDLGNTALHYAIEIEKPNLVQMIMKKNPNTNLVNKNNKTALMLAKEINNEAVLQALNNPFGPYVVSKGSDNEILNNYRQEIQTYITPYFNNNYPEYTCTSEMKNVKNEVYSRFANTEKTVLKDPMLWLLLL